MDRGGKKQKDNSKTTYNEYPTINLEAYKLFTIPPTSAEVERDFSMSTAVLSPGRASMRSEVKNQAIIVLVNEGIRIRKMIV